MTISTSQPQATVSKVNPRIIDLTDSIPDVTSNLIVDSEHYQLPPDIFENALYEALNDLIDDFAQNPNRYLKPKHYARIDAVAHEYINS